MQMCTNRVLQTHRHVREYGQQQRMNHTVNMCLLTKSEDRLQLLVLQKAEEDAVKWLEYIVATALAK